MIFKYFSYLYLLSLLYALFNFFDQTKIILYILLQIIIIIFFLISKNYKTIFFAFLSLYILEFFLIHLNIFHKNLDNSDHLHFNGFFVGNNHEDLSSNIKLLKKILS